MVRLSHTDLFDFSIWVHATYTCLPNASSNHVNRPIGWFKLVIDLPGFVLAVPIVQKTQRINKFGGKNINLATTIDEKKSLVKMFIWCWKLPPRERHLPLKVIDLCRPCIWYSDFIWPFLRPYMGVIPNPKMVFIFPISCILALIFPIVIKYFPKCEKGSFLKSQIVVNY